MESYIYSFGKDSPLKFKLTEEFANAYNRALQAFFDAQERFLKTKGRRWTPEDHIAMRWSDHEMFVFNSFDNVLQTALMYYGKPVPEEDLPEDFLVKN